MRSYEEIERTSREGVAFSNGSEWSCWSARWCEDCEHDQDQDSGGCPLIAFAMLEGRTPAEWIPGATDEQGRVSLSDRYGCLEFKRVSG